MLMLLSLSNSCLIVGNFVVYLINKFYQLCVVDQHSHLELLEKQTKFHRFYLYIKQLSFKRNSIGPDVVHGFNLVL